MRKINPFVFLSFVFCISVSFAYTQTSISVNHKAKSNKETADISFKVINLKVNKVFVRVPNSNTLEPYDTSSEDDRVQFIKVKLLPGLNVINIQAYSGDDFIDNTAVRIEYKPDPVEGNATIDNENDSQPPVMQNTARQATNGTGKPPITSKTATVRKIAFAESVPVETDKPTISAKITVENLPDDAAYILVENITDKSLRVSPKEIIKTGKVSDSPQTVSIKLTAEENNIRVSISKTKDKKDEIKEVEAITRTIYCAEPCQYIPRSVNTRAIVGIEQTGASSADSQSSPFIDIFVNAPIGRGSYRRLRDGQGDFVRNEKGEFIKVLEEPRFSAWADFRFSSTTVQSFASLANVSNTVINPFFTKDSSINNIVQSFQVNAGIDVRIINEGRLQSFFIPGKNSVSLIAGGGVTNPLKSEQTAQVFKIPMLNRDLNPAFTNLFPKVDFTGKTNIAFVSPERDRFFRRWFVGLRMKTRFFANEDRNSIIEQSPAMFDVTIGQDEAITKKMTGQILTLEGFTPFPVKKYDFIYLFGGVTTRLTRRVNESIPPFFLQPITDFNLTDSNTVAVPIDSSPFTRTSRDTFRFGIGIDLIKLLNRSND